MASRREGNAAGILKVNGEVSVFRVALITLQLNQHEVKNLEILQ
jgi:hypothetical protein